MADEKHSPKWWTHYLGNDEGEFTLEEYQAGCISRALGLLVEIAGASGHLEGMLGSLDTFMAGRNDDYQQISSGRGRPAPMKLGEGEHDA